jgi:hypothetical protein
VIEVAFALALQVAEVDIVEEYPLRSAWFRCARTAAWWIEKSGETVAETARLATLTCPEREQALLQFIADRAGEEGAYARVDSIRSAMASSLEGRIAVLRSCAGRPECLAFFQGHGLDPLER